MAYTPSGLLISSLSGSAANNTLSSIAAAGIGPGYTIRTNPANLGTAVNSTSVITTDGAATTNVFIGTTTTGTFIIEMSFDGTNFAPAEVFDASIDMWVTGQNLTPTSGKGYHVATGASRLLRLRTVTTLGATVVHGFTQTAAPMLVTAVDIGPAPHAMGYMPVHRDGEYATAQTGTALWTPTSGRRFVVTDLTITTGGTTAGIVTLWQGAAADTTYNAGTDPAIFRGNFIPSATATPGVVKPFPVPYYSTTVDHILRVTTSAAMTVYIQVNGYETL